MNCKGFRRKWPWPIRAVISPFMRESEKTSTKGITARMWTRHLLNTSQKHYPTQHSCGTENHHKHQKEKEKRLTTSTNHCAVLVWMYDCIVQILWLCCANTIQNTNNTNGHLWSYSFCMFRHFHLNLVMDLVTFHHTTMACGPAKDQTLQTTHNTLYLPQRDKFQLSREYVHGTCLTFRAITRRHLIFQMTNLENNPHPTFG